MGVCTCPHSVLVEHTFRTLQLIKLSLWLHLFRAYSAGFDLRTRIVLTLDGLARQATQHRDLAHMSKCIGNRPLKHTFAARRQFAVRSEILIELRQGRMKTLDLLTPWKWLSVVPGFIPFGDRQGPIQQISNVRQDLNGRAG